MTGKSLTVVGKKPVVSSRETTTRLKAARLKSGMKSKDVASRIGTTSQHYGRMEAGKTPLQDHWLQRLADLFMVKPIDLLEVNDVRARLYYTTPAEAAAHEKEGLHDIHSPPREVIPLFDAPVLRRDLFSHNKTAGVHQLGQVRRQSMAHEDYAILILPKNLPCKRGDVVFLDSIPYIESEDDDVVCVPISRPDKWFICTAAGGTRPEKTLAAMGLPAQDGDFDLYRIITVIPGRDLFMRRPAE